MTNATKKKRPYCLTGNQIIKANLVLRALNQGLRQDILSFLQKREAQGEESCVQDIYEALRVEQSVASQHLAILRREGILWTARSGKKIL